VTAGAPRTVAISIPTIPLRIRIGILARSSIAILASIRRSILISSPILASTAIPIFVGSRSRSPSPLPT
jgi:hypothetical protein